MNNQVGLHGRIRHFANTAANQIAIEFGDVRITYGQLEQRSSEMAHYFHQRLTGNKHVGIMLDKSPELIEAIVGLLKTGGVFAPLDPAMPDGRLLLMLESIDAEWIITEPRYLSKLSEALKHSERAWKIVVLKSAESMEEKDDPHYPKYYSYAADENSQAIWPDEIVNKHCYLYFTSGTTGKPKAVLGRHRSLLHFIEWETAEFGVHALCRFGQLTSPSFDPFLRDIFVPLCAGAAICIPEHPEIIYQPGALLHWLERQRVTFVHMVPSLFKVLSSEITATDRLEQLTHVLLAGELLKGHDIRRFVEYCGDRIQIVNLYGPTETTLAKCFYRVSRNDAERTIIPVGRPLPQTTVIVLDDKLRVCDTGEAGGVYIRTPFISSGYYGDKESTRKAFIPNPFSHNPQDILYRTGDIGRMLPDGLLEVIGREDQQLKIRGHRVELSEIERAIRTNETIKDAVVTASQDSYGDSSLTVYYVSDENISTSHWRQFVSKLLPAYMIPSAYIRLPEIPLTINGKLDRGALPQPAAIHAVALPETELQRALAAIWLELLNRSEIGIHDDFFEHGGHSLTAARLIARVQQELQVELAYSDIFHHSTIAQLAQCIEAKTTKRPVPAVITANVEDEAIVPVSPSQHSMFVANALEKEQTAYNVNGVYSLTGRLDIQRLQEALEQLMERHESLRTSFAWIDGQPFQRIHRHAAVQLDVLEAGQRTADAVFQSYIRPFELHEAPLFRVGLLALEPERHLLIADFHHIICDGTSIWLFMKQLLDLYCRRPVHQLRYQYRELQAARRVSPERLQSLESFWLSRLQREWPVLQLPADRPRPLERSGRGMRIALDVDRELKQAIDRIARDHRVTDYMALLACYFIWLHLYSGQQEIVVGTPFSGRQRTEEQDVIGMFVQTVPLLAKLESGMRLADFLQMCKQEVLFAYEHQHVPFDAVIQQLHRQRDTSRNLLFDTLFVLHRSDQLAYEHRELAACPYEVLIPVSKYDVSLQAMEAKGKLSLRFEFSADLFDASTAHRMAAHYIHILKQMASCTAETAIGQFELATDADKRQVAELFNQTEVPLTDKELCLQWFEEQAQRTPERIAVESEQGQFTYQMVNERANRLAEHLHRLGAGPDRVVGLLLTRSPELIVSMLAVWKSGAAYLPISPDHPAERVRDMLEESGVQAILTQRQFRGRIPYQAEWIEVDGPACHAEAGKAWTGPQAGANHLAYVLYTSGTTGKPKGVMIEHQALTNRIVWMQRAYPLGEQDVIMHKTPYTFDVSVWELVWWSMAGARLILLPPGAEKDPEAILSYIRTYQVTVMHFVPSMFDVFLAYMKAHGIRAESISSLRYIFLSGEALHIHHLKLFYSLFGTDWPGKLVNLYGPTEAAIDVASYECSPLDMDEDTVPIGKPIQNLNLYIVNDRFSPQPVGVPGELCIGGIGVARGYMNQPALTDEKFVANPFRSGGGRLYRAGDIAKWREDGSIEYLGRRDHQVKLNGIRVELEEIEACLLEHPDVSQAVVLLTQSEHRSGSLCAYLVCDREATAAQLKAHLHRKLPAYMVPAFFVFVTEIPVTPHGKVDRKALPQPAAEPSGTVEAPRDDIETQLLGVWRQVLGFQQIDIHSNFFEWGGDSIKALQVISRLQEIGLKATHKQLFRYPTIAALSPYVEHKKAGGERSGTDRKAPLTPIQRWFYEAVRTDRHHWNQSILLFSPARLEEAWLREAFQALIRHHEMLRAVFPEDDQEMEALINDAEEESLAAFHSYVIDGDENVRERIAHEAERLQQSLALHTGPLFKAALFETDHGHYLFLLAHHLLVDGMSWRVLIEDLCLGYEQMRSGQPIQLPYKSASYPEWSRRISEAAHSPRFMKQTEYWRSIEQMNIASLPVDMKGADHTMADAEVCEVVLSGHETALLMTEAHRAYHTETNDLLLTALGWTLRDWVGEDSLVIGVEGHGRESIGEDDIDVIRTVGWFTSLYPIVLSMKYTGSLSYQIKTIKEELRRIPDKGIGYGMLKYLTPQLPGSWKPEVLFNYLGQMDLTLPSPLFSYSDNEMGKTRSPHGERTHPLVINAMVLRGCLTVRLEYSRKQFHSHTIRQLGERLRNRIRDILQHCLDKQASERTPSDYGSGHLSIEEVDDIAALVQRKLGM